ARPTEGQRRIDLVLDVDQRVENHGAELPGVDGIGVPARVLAALRIIAVDLEGPYLRLLRAGGLRPGLARLDLRILRQPELDHAMLKAPGGRTGGNLPAGRQVGRAR